MASTDMTTVVNPAMVAPVPASTAVINPAVLQILNQQRDSRWLTLEVCREYQRCNCKRSSEECKYAHPPSGVEVQNGRVTCCFDSIKGKCQRTEPPCKYLHPPNHLKEKLIENGRANLIQRAQVQAMVHNALMQGVIQPAAPVMYDPSCQAPLSPVVPIAVSTSYPSPPIMANLGNGMGGLTASGTTGPYSLISPSGAVVHTMETLPMFAPTQNFVQAPPGIFHASPGSGTGTPLALINTPNAVGPGVQQQQQPQSASTSLSSTATVSQVQSNTVSTCMAQPSKINMTQPVTAVSAADGGIIATENAAAVADISAAAAAAAALSPAALQQVGMKRKFDEALLPAVIADPSAVFLQQQQETTYQHFPQQQPICLASSQMIMGPAPNAAKRTAYSDASCGNTISPYSIYPNSIGTTQNGSLLNYKHAPMVAIQPAQCLPMQAGGIPMATGTLQRY